MIYYVGDLHANLNAIKRIDQACHDGVVVQVGDFGIGFENPCPIFDYFLNTDGPQWFTCGGNHDNWDFHETGPTMPMGRFKWVPRGEIEVIDDQRHLFFGGAESVDKHSRVEGVSWWRQEVPSFEETIKFLDALHFEDDLTDVSGVDVVVAHDAPSFVVDRMYGQHHAPSVMCHDLEGIYKTLSEAQQPEAWYYGHHHPDVWDLSLRDDNDTETDFMCLGIETVVSSEPNSGGPVLRPEARR